jgi:hypothetical protein
MNLRCALFAGLPTLWFMLTMPAAYATPPAAAVPDSVFAHPATTSELAELTRATTGALQGAKVIRGKFVQRRHLAGLAQPLESSGRFLFAREAGVEWHTEQPFDSVFVLTESGITQRDEGGPPLRIAAADQPALAVLSRVFFALFALDLDVLSRDFQLFGERRGTGWVLGLRPRTAALGGVFRQAIVSGGASVERVVLEDGNGDRSEIDLREVQYDRSGMNEEERRRF